MQDNIYSFYITDVSSYMKSEQPSIFKNNIPESSLISTKNN